ncbi:hypothetical protein SCHPADRAFT_944406 [Schizopora paradoxa]|uniref:Protein kinase domain-containing protein n=1 Tax=Schizopora paradoxa TaxID=27342 RepID=A0A0H2RAS8_9AGAM|nr:hypothetical protein SCHPADRAFT_944406 [Schizopora paradoxa]
MDADWRSRQSSSRGSPAPSISPSSSRFNAGAIQVSNYSDLRWSKRRASVGSDNASNARDVFTNEWREARSQRRTTVGLGPVDSQETGGRLLVSPRPSISASGSPRAPTLALPSRSGTSSTSNGWSPAHSEYSPSRPPLSLRSSPRSAFSRLHPMSANHGRADDISRHRSNNSLDVDFEGPQESTEIKHASMPESPSLIIPSRSRKSSFTSLLSTSSSPAQRNAPWRPGSNTSGVSIPPPDPLRSSRLTGSPVYRLSGGEFKGQRIMGGVLVGEPSGISKQLQGHSFDDEREQGARRSVLTPPSTNNQRSKPRRWQSARELAEESKATVILSPTVSPPKLLKNVEGARSTRPTQKLVSGSHKSLSKAELSLNDPSSISSYGDERWSSHPSMPIASQTSSSLLEIAQALRSKVDSAAMTDDRMIRRSSAKFVPRVSNQRSEPRSTRPDKRSQPYTSFHSSFRSPSNVHSSSHPDFNDPRESLIRHRSLRSSRLDGNPQYNGSYAHLRRHVQKPSDEATLGGGHAASRREDCLQDHGGPSNCGNRYGDIAVSERRGPRLEHGDPSTTRRQQSLNSPQPKPLSTLSTDDIQPETQEINDRRLLKVPSRSVNGRSTKRTRVLPLRMLHSENSTVLQRENLVGSPIPPSQSLSHLSPPLAVVLSFQSSSNTCTTEANSSSLPFSRRSASSSLASGDEDSGSRSSRSPGRVITPPKSSPPSSFELPRTNAEDEEFFLSRERKEARTESVRPRKHLEEADEQRKQDQAEGGEVHASDDSPRAALIDSRKPSYEERLKRLLAGLRSLDLSEDLYDENIHRSACGGYSDIHQAKSRRHDGMLVAVKRLRFRITDENAWKPVYRELNVWSGLDHPNIHMLLGYAMRGEYPALISRWMSKGSAQDYFKGNSGIAARHMTKGIAAGLKFLHDQGIVHSDLKAENIFISDEGEPLLADFGISRILSSATITTSSNVKGSPRWMAIELLALPSDDFDGKYNHTKETDIWAFGMVVYELLTKTVPFDYLKHNIHVVLAITSNRLPSQPTSLDDKDGQLLWSLCERCWSKNPRDRPDIAWISTHLS